MKIKGKETSSPNSGRSREAREPTNRLAFGTDVPVRKCCSSLAFPEVKSHQTNLKGKLLGSQVTVFLIMSDIPSLCIREF